MSVYNEKAEYLRESIESILNQTFKDFEFIIINDGSTDPICNNILAEYSQKDLRIKLIRLERDSATVGNQGLTRALNKGMEIAIGKYIARMDSDDISKPERLKKQLEFMENNPSYALCGSWCDIIDGSGKIIGKNESYTEYEEIRKKIISVNHFTHSTLFFKKDIIKSFGGYSREMIKAQDYDLLLKIIAKHPVAIIGEYLLDYRMIEKSISFSNNKLQEKYALKARRNALKKYGYPKIYYSKMTIPCLMHWLLPSSVKEILLKLLWKI